MITNQHIMQTYISILRGINVSGQKTIKMDALRAMFEDLKFTNVKTYIQSGNVIFQYKKTDCKSLENIISQKIKEEFTFDVPVIVITKEDFENIYNNNLFVNDHNKDIQKLHVTFLSQIPNQLNINKIAGNFAPDEFIFNETAIYLYCPEGYGSTKLNNNFFESKLKVTATTRNWKTVTELMQLAKSI
jgi:uncharacterized protein (DUF1697 family)